MKSIVLLSVRWPLMKAHRIRKRRIEKFVVPARDIFQDLGKGGPAVAVKVAYRRQVVTADQQYLKGPHRPKRHHCGEVGILKNDSFLFLILDLQIRTEQAL